MEAIALRRTKDMALVCLPPKTVEICYVELSMEERQLYDREKEKTKALLRRSFIYDDSQLSQYTEMLSSILRLRQICVDLKLCKFHSQRSITNNEGIIFPINGLVRFLMLSLSVP